MLAKVRPGDTSATTQDEIDDAFDEHRIQDGGGSIGQDQFDPDCLVIRFWVEAKDRDRAVEMARELVAVRLLRLGETYASVPIVGIVHADEGTPAESLPQWPMPRPHIPNTES